MYRRIVVKLGTSVLTGGTPKLDRPHMVELARQCATLHRQGTDIIVPIINENDAVATAEIKVGDNDNLSALVVLLAEADLLILLTDQPGLFTADPRTNPNAQLIPEVQAIDDTLRGLAGGSISGLGVGGMATKLQAADIARRAGADVVIAAGRAPEVITRLAAKEPVGTRFPALETPLENRKRWIFAGPTPAGSLMIDAGPSGRWPTRSAACSRRESRPLTALSSAAIPSLFYSRTAANSPAASPATTAPKWPKSSAAIQMR